MSECVLCEDWAYDPFAAPLAAFLVGAVFPLRWYPDGPGPVWVSASVADTVAEVACVAHWAEAHPAQLELALGEPFEVRLMGATPPVDTVYGVDLASGSDSVTIVKAKKIWFAPLPPPHGADGAQDGDVWVDIGGLVSPLEFRYKQGFEE